MWVTTRAPSTPRRSSCRRKGRRAAGSACCRRHTTCSRRCSLASARYCRARGSRRSSTRISPGPASGSMTRTTRAAASARMRRWRGGSVDWCSAAPGGGSVGMDIGDCVGYRMANVQIQNFSGAGSVGLYLVNRYFFTERSHFQARLHGNAQNCVLDTVSGQGENSFEFDYFDFILSANATGSGQDGFVIQGGSYISKGFLRLTGNFVTSGHALTSAAVRVQGNEPITGFINHLTHFQLLVGVETDNASANAPATIIFGTTSGSNINSITNCTGFLVFDDGWTASNAVAATFGPFGGMIVGDAGLQALNAANPPPGWPS